MLCPSVFQPSPISMRPVLDLHWPVRSLWPDARPLFYHMEQEMIRHIQEMRHSMEFMEKLHQKIFEEIDHSSSSSASSGVFRPIFFQELGGDSSTFALSLDTKEFSPEELSVKQVGRKLRVSGRTEQKRDDQRGSYSYRCQEFRQEFDLPHGVDPEAVSCSLVDGRLQIQAPRDRAAADGKERIVPISFSSAPAVTSPSSPSPSSSHSEGAEESRTSPSERTE